MSETEKEKVLAEHQDERSECLVYTRVMGYCRPTNSFNSGKTQEFAEREFFSEPTCCCGK